MVEVVAVALDQTSYVMKEYSRGNLQDLVEGSLSLQAALKAAMSLCRSVDEIHQEGLMVRSWKPSNLFVEEGELVIGELDMVHLSTMAQYRADLFGYRSYVAPEEIIGGGTRSPSADVYSLGKVLEYILTREEPSFPPGDHRIVESRDNIPETLVNIVRRATAPEASERYQAAGYLLHDLSVYQLQGDRSVLAASIRPVIPRQLSVRPLSRNPDLPKLQEVIEKHKERARKHQKSVGTSSGRQLELALALLGGLGGLAVVVLLIVSPVNVDKMEGMLPYLSGAVALSVFGLRRPERRALLARIATWAGAAAFFYLINPLQLSQITWRSRLSKGTLEQRELAAQNLARIGVGDFSGANLAGANLSGKDFASADFANADLSKANFSTSFLSETNFSGADLSEASFVGANLHGAKMITAVGLGSARCDHYTVLPEELECLMGKLSVIAPGISHHN